MAARCDLEAAGDDYPLEPWLGMRWDLSARFIHLPLRANGLGASASAGCALRGR